MRLIIKHTIILVLLSCLKISAQIESVNLPDINEKLGMIALPYFSISIIDENHVLFDKDTIPIQLISDSIFLNSKMFKSYGFKSLYIKTHVHLFADKEINYNIVDKIKTQISRTNKSRYVIYRSNFDTQIGKGVKREGIKHKSPLSFFKLEIPEYKETAKEIKRKDSIRKLEEEKFPDLIEMNKMLDNAKGNWQPVYQLESIIYGSQKDIIQEHLQSKKTKCYRITNVGFKDTVKSYKRNEILDMLIRSEVVFLDYDNDLTYHNYLKFINELHKSIPNFGQKRVNTDVIELSNEIKRIHSMNGVKLCD